MTNKQAKYFKDSKIRSADELLIAYHGTNHTFNTFEVINTEPGYWFSIDRSKAEEYGKNILEVYLNIQNPLNIRDMALCKEYFYEFFGDKTPCMPWLNKEQYNYDFRDFRDFLIKKGHDGIIWDNVIIAFYPNQIKTIDNLNPTKSNNIYM